MRRLKQVYEKNPALFCFHLLLRLTVLGLLFWKLILRAWVHAGLCLLTLLLFAIPALSRRVLHMSLPPMLDAIICLFAVCADVCGEMFCLYLRFPWWDSMLHLLWGFLAGLIGCALIEIWQGELLKPKAAALCVLSFAALTGVLWEFFEYFMDSIFATDMQKDVWLHEISSVLLNPLQENTAMTECFDSVLVNDQLWPGMIDIGLHDTMQDMLLTFLGSIPAAFVLRFQNRNSLCAWLVRLLKPVLPEKIAKN